MSPAIRLTARPARAAVAILLAAAAAGAGAALHDRSKDMQRQEQPMLTTLRSLNAKFIHNFVTNDVASHDAILHERFTSILPNGARLSRQDYLTAWATGFDPDVIVYWDYRDERIDIFGDKVALVSSTNKWVRRRDGAEVTGMTRYTDTYVFDRGAWKCVLAQLTNVTPEHFPADSTIVKKYIRGRLVD
jgi:Domain of unknown function (DUF4440)